LPKISVDRLDANYINLISGNFKQDAVSPTMSGKLITPNKKSNISKSVVTSN
jgi:hypothetical protein